MNMAPNERKKTEQQLQNTSKDFDVNNREFRTRPNEFLTKKAIEKMGRKGIRKRSDLVHQLLHAWATTED